MFSTILSLPLLSEITPYKLLYLVFVYDYASRYVYIYKFYSHACNQVVCKSYPGVS
jgi:hypothetical protein